MSQRTLLKVDSKNLGGIERIIQLQCYWELQWYKKVFATYIFFVYMSNVFFLQYLSYMNQPDAKYFRLIRDISKASITFFSTEKAQVYAVCGNPIPLYVLPLPLCPASFSCLLLCIFFPMGWKF